MPAEPAVYRGLNMTLEELRTKDDEELMRLNMDGSITDNEYFLATEAYRDLYLAWLHGRQPTMITTTAPTSMYHLALTKSLNANSALERAGI